MCFGIKLIFGQPLVQVYELMETAIHSPPCDEPAEAASITSEPTVAPVVSCDDKCDLPEPIPFLDAEKVIFQKSMDHQQAQQFIKADFGHLFSRIFEVKSSLFEKKHLRPFTVVEDRRPAPTVSGEWTFV